MKATSLISSFETEKWFLRLGGYYPVENRPVISVIFGIFMFIYSWAEFISMIVLLFIEKNLTKLSETFLFCMTQAAFLCKLMNFLYKNNTMLVIEDLLESPNLLDAQEKKLLDGYLQEVYYLARLFRILCILVVVFYGLFPFIDEDPEHMLPLPGWFPFDVKNHQYKLIVAQVCGIGMGAFLNSTLDILPTILITIGCAQFDIFKNRLRNLRNRENLNDCVKFHTTLLKYLKCVEELFSNGILVQFLATVIVICLTGFQMLVIPIKSVQFVLLMIYFSTMTCQVILYCWYGNELMFRSMGITDACYFSDWTNLNEEIRKSIVLVMERTKKPTILTAGNLFPLTLTTLMAILKSSYSYFAVLQRLYSKST